MRENIRKAFAEVNDILKHSKKEIQDKIPKNVNTLIENNIDTNYDIKIDYSISINKQTLLPETRDILAMIYMDYLCKEEEKFELINKNNQYRKNNEQKYDIIRIFKQRQQDNIIEDTKQLQVDVKSNTWYKNIVIFIKKILRK